MMGRFIKSNIRKNSFDEHCDEEIWTAALRGEEREKLNSLKHFP
jgi:hypothetical protein